MVVSPSFRRVREKGFTLLEVLLALMIATLAIFSLIRFTSYQHMKIRENNEARFLTAITRACQNYIHDHRDTLIRIVGDTQRVVEVPIFGTARSKKGVRSPISVQDSGHLPLGIANMSPSSNDVSSPLGQKYYLLVKGVSRGSSNDIALEGLVFAKRGKPLEEDRLGRIDLLGGPSVGFVKTLGIGGLPAGSITSLSGFWHFPEGSWGKLNRGHPVGYTPLADPSRSRPSRSLKEPWLARIAYKGDPKFNKMKVDLDMGGKEIKNAGSVATSRLMSATGDKITIPPGNSVVFERTNTYFSDGGGVTFSGPEGTHITIGSTKPGSDRAGDLTLMKRGNAGGDLLVEGGDVIVRGGSLKIQGSGGSIDMSMGDRKEGLMLENTDISVTNGSVNLLGGELRFSPAGPVAEGEHVTLRYQRNRKRGLVIGTKFGRLIVDFNASPNSHDPSWKPGLSLKVIGPSSKGVPLFISNSLQISGDLTVKGELREIWGVVSQSDRRLKTDIDPISPVESLSNILSLKPVSFRWKDSARMKGDNGRKHLGFVAQDVENIIPELVTGGEGQSSKGLDYSGLVAPVVGAVQELYARFRTFTQTLQKKLNNMAALIGKNTQNIEVIRKELVNVKAVNAQLERDNAQLRQRLEHIRAVVLAGKAETSIDKQPWGERTRG